MKRTQNLNENLHSKRKKTTIKTDRETILSHHIESIHNIRIDKIKTLKGIDNTKTSEIQLNHIHCESTEDESETENILVINMPRIEHNFEITIETNSYQNDNPNSTLQKPKTMKNTT